MQDLQSTGDTLRLTSPYGFTTELPLSSVHRPIAYGPRVERSPPANQSFHADLTSTAPPNSPSTAA
ncbi:MAG: hypothetical protein R3B90_20160 [Planctomycetaceae bacterium]